MNIDQRRLMYLNSDLIRLRRISYKVVMIDWYNKTHNIQIGSGDRKLKVEYENNIYVFEESTIDDNHFVLYSFIKFFDEKNFIKTNINRSPGSLYSVNEDECVIVIISKDGIAEIHGIGNYKNCVRFTNQNIGSHLLKITIKMLKKYKNKFGIKMITLTDNSIKKCNKTQIKLSTMLILTNGNTWYGKYGFRPIEYQDDKYVLSEILNEHGLVKLCFTSTAT
jgi:hypothetical protein